LADEGGKVLSPAHRPPLSSLGNTPMLISVRGWVDTMAIVRPERLREWISQWPHRESNPRLSACNSSTNCVPPLLQYGQPTYFWRIIVNKTIKRKLIYF
jgi:hypothetical protein